MIGQQFWLQTWFNIPVKKPVNKFPWFSEKQIQQLYKDTTNVPIEKRAEVQYQLYKEILPQLKTNELKDKRIEAKANIYNDSLEERDIAKKNISQAQLKMEDLADQVKDKYNLIPTAPTNEVLEWFSRMLADQQVDPKLADDYLNWKSEELLYVSGLKERPVEKEKNLLWRIRDSAIGILDEWARLWEWWIWLLDKALWEDEVSAMAQYGMEKYWLRYNALSPEQKQGILDDIKNNPNILNEYKTTVSEDVLNIWQGLMTSAWVAVAPGLMGWITAVSATKPWQAVLAPVVKAFWTLGNLINYIPWLSDFKNSLPPEQQEEFDMFVWGIVWSMLLWTKWKKNIVKDPKKFISENIGSKQIINNFMENVVGIKEWVVSWVKSSWKYIAEKLDPSIKLDKKAMQEAISNPYTVEYINKIHKETDWAMYQVDKWFKDAQIKEVWDTYIKPELDKKIETYKEWWSLYNKLKETKQQINIDWLDIEAQAIMDKYWPQISVKNETLVKNAMKEVDKAIETSKLWRFDVETALAVRRNLSDMADYTERWTVANQAVKEIRAVLDRMMKEQVNWLKEIDEFSKKQIKDINAFKKQLINNEWNINYANLKNVNNLSKTDLAIRLDEFVPWATDRIDAITKAIDISKKTKWMWLTAKIGSKGVMAWLWSVITGWPRWAVLWLVLEPAVTNKIAQKISTIKQNKILKLFEWMSDEAIKRLQEIDNKIKNNTELTQKDLDLIDKAKQKYKDNTKKNPLVLKEIVDGDSSSNIGANNTKNTIKRTNKVKQEYIDDWLTTKQAEYIIENFDKKWLYNTTRNKKYLEFQLENNRAKFDKQYKWKILEFEKNWKKYSIDYDKDPDWFLLADEMIDKNTIKDKPTLKTLNEKIIQPRAMVKAPEEPLMAEARKYKSAEEFVNSKEKVYHWTNAKFDEFDIKKIWSQTDEGIWGRWIYFSPNKEMAKIAPWWNWARYIKEVIVDKSKLFDISKYKDIQKLADDLDMWEWNFTMGSDGIIRPNQSQIRQLTTHIEDLWYEWVYVNRWWKWDELVIFDPKNIKTESQLKQIREQANKK